MIRKVSFAVLKLCALVVSLVLLVLYFRLGWFLWLVWPIGAVLAVAFTGGQWRQITPASVGFLLVLIGYAGLVALAWHLLVDRPVEETFVMSWLEIGSHGEAVVEFEFLAHPGHYVGENSTELRDYLRSREETTVDVAFEVRKALGVCTSQLNVARVGQLEAWRSHPGGYSRAVGDSPSPWENPWWCP